MREGGRSGFEATAERFFPPNGGGATRHGLGRSNRAVAEMQRSPPPTPSATVKNFLTKL